MQLHSLGGRGQNPIYIPFGDQINVFSPASCTNESVVMLLNMFHITSVIYCQIVVNFLILFFEKIHVWEMPTAHMKTG